MCVWFEWVLRKMCVTLFLSFVLDVCDVWMSIAWDVCDTLSFFRRILQILSAASSRYIRILCPLRRHTIAGTGMHLRMSLQHTGAYCNASHNVQYAPVCCSDNVQYAPVCCSDNVQYAPVCCSDIVWCIAVPSWYIRHTHLEWKKERVSHTSRMKERKSVTHIFRNTAVSIHSAASYKYIRILQMCGTARCSASSTVFCGCVVQNAHFRRIAVPHIRRMRMYL